MEMFPDDEYFAHVLPAAYCALSSVWERLVFYEVFVDDGLQHDVQYHQLLNKLNEESGRRLDASLAEVILMFQRSILFPFLNKHIRVFSRAHEHNRLLRLQTGQFNLVGQIRELLFENWPRE